MTWMIAITAVAAAAVLSTMRSVVASVLVAVVAGVAATALWQLILNTLDHAARREKLAKVREKYALPRPTLEGGVAQLLRPEEEVVSFRPRPELDQLIEWVADSAQRVGVQLVTGDGGTGKTRLARQLAHEIDGWRTQWLHAGSERQGVETAKDIGEPVLLVVDYAETRFALQELLLEVVSDTDGPDMRLLLLARSAGEWWRQLISNSEYRLSELLAAVQPITLGPVSDIVHQPEVFYEALAAFADKLGVECPETKIALTDPGAVVLAIHASALLTILEHSYDQAIGEAPSDMTKVLAGLLRHEARYWQQSQAARGLRLDSDVTRRVVAAGCLIGADDEASAMELLAAITDLADPAVRGPVARWLRDLYPVPQFATGANEWIGLLQPDLIAEHLVVSVLAQHPDLIPALFGGLGDKRAAKALTLLARAALADSVAAGQLETALKSDPENLLIPLLGVATETNAEVGDIIKRTIETANIPNKILERISLAIPHPSFALAEAAVVTLEKLIDLSDNHLGKRALWVLDLAGRLVEIGRLEESMVAIEEAVNIGRVLAQDQSDDMLGYLALSLHNKVGILSNLGRRQEAETALEEAVSIRRALASRSDEFMAYLASSLSAQSGLMSELGKRKEALAKINEAVTIYRKLAKARPDAILPSLASSLINQSSRLSALGRQEDALPIINEAVTIYRKLADIRPAAFLPDLAVSLTGQSASLGGLGRFKEALIPINEAVTVNRALAQIRPAVFLPNLAMSLTNQSACMSGLGRQEDALPIINEAVTIYRKLAKDRPAAFLHYLAFSLENQSDFLEGLGRFEEALAPISEAVVVNRELAQKRPGEFLANLIRALENLAICLTKLKREPEADAARIEAGELSRGVRSAD